MLADERYLARAVLPGRQAPNVGEAPLAAVGGVAPGREQLGYPLPGALLQALDQFLRVVVSAVAAVVFRTLRFGVIEIEFTASAVRYNSCIFLVRGGIKCGTHGSP